MCAYFFFSSRRRHTRSLCDWSSDVCSSDLKENSEQQRNVKEEIQRDSGSENFRKIAGGDGKFAGDPQENGHAARVVVAAGLGEVAARNNPKFRGKRLKKHRKNIADEHDA